MNEYKLMEWRITLRLLIRNPRLVCIFIITLATTLSVIIAFLTLNTSLFEKQAEKEAWLKDLSKQYIVAFQSKFPTQNIKTSSLLHTFYKNNQTDFDGISLYIRGKHSIELPTYIAELETAFVSDNYFSQAGLSFEYGIGFKEYRELVISAPLTPPVLLTYQLWLEKFSKNSAIVGQEIKIGNRYFNVAGILKAGMNPLKRLGFKPPQIYKPLFYNNKILIESSQISNGDTVLIAPSQTHQVEQYGRAAEQRESKLKQLIKHPILSQLPVNANIMALKKSTLVYNEKLLWPWMLGVILLLLACSCLYSLLLIRNLASEYNCAIYKAIGARQRHIFYMLLRQNFLLSFASGITALFITFWMIELTQFTNTIVLPTTKTPSLNLSLFTFILVSCGLITLALTCICFYFVSKNNGNDGINLPVTIINYHDSKLTSITLVVQSALMSILLCFSILFVEQSMSTEEKSNKPLSFVSFIEQENNPEKDIIKAKELLVLGIGILLCFFSILVSVVSIQTIVKLKITLALNNINYQKALGANLISLFEKYSIGIIKPCLLGIFAGVLFTLYSAQSNIIYTNLFSSITLFYLILIVTTIVFILLITVLMSVFNGIKAQCLGSVKF